MSARWTQDEDELVIKYKNSGISNKEISNIIGRTEIAVKHRAEKLGLCKTVSRWPKEDEIKLSELFNTLTLEDLSIIFNRSTDAIRRKILSMNLRDSKFKSKTWTSDDIKQLIELKGKKLPNKEIASILNRSEAAIESMITEQGLGTGIYYPKKSHEEFVEEVRNINHNIILLEDYTNRNVKMLVKYKDCGHEEYIVPTGLIHKGSKSICPLCFPKIRSRGEIELEEYLKSLGLNTVHSVRDIIYPLEIDIFIPDHLLGIEYNGEVYHSDKFKEDSENYHLNKLMLANNAAIDLIHIWEHEWKEKNAIVKSRLKSILGLNNKIFARKTTLKTISWVEAKEFLDRCHIQGSGAATKINLGLYLEEELVAVMTFSKGGFINKKYEYCLTRYCSDLNTTVIGGASKLLKYFILSFKPNSIVSYSDKRWGTGNLYKKLGFHRVRINKPSYFYVKGTKIVNRHKAKKSELLNLIPDYYNSNLTEKEMMSNAGYHRCYDCGTDTWGLIL